VDLAVEGVQPGSAKGVRKSVSKRAPRAHARPTAHPRTRDARSECAVGNVRGSARASSLQPPSNNLFSAAATSRSEDPLSMLTCCRPTGLDTSASMDCRALGVVDAILTPAAAKRPSLQSKAEHGSRVSAHRRHRRPRTHPHARVCAHSHHCGPRAGRVPCEPQGRGGALTAAVWPSQSF
jgi:hypothetical protein